MEKRFIENYKKWYWFIPFVLFVLDFIFIKAGIMKSVDCFVYQSIQPLISPSLTTFFKFVSFLGSGLFYVIVIAVLMIVQFKKGLNIGVHLLIIQIINRIVKALVKRPRPDKIYHLVQETNYSFPSGHAMSAMIGYILFIQYVKDMDIRHKNILIFLLGSMIFLIGFSRIYLGVHYFSDVIGGYLLSLSYYWFISHNTSLHT